MCLAIPARVTRLNGLLATVEVGGVEKQVSVQLLERVAEGNYVLIHAGFALSCLDEAEARQTMRILEQMGDLEEGSLG